MIKPISLKQANEYVEKHHRHHKAVRGCKFCISLVENDEIIGVAICGRPVSRYYDNGTTLEINRLCTNGFKNACSQLYGACCRIAKEMGYKKSLHIPLKARTVQALERAILSARESRAEKNGQAAVKGTPAYRKK